MSKNEIREKVQSLARMLCKEIPNSQYGSYYSLFSDGLYHNLITKEEFQIAEDYYGNIWNYAGD